MRSIKLFVSLVPVLCACSQAAGTAPAPSPTPPCPEPAPASPVASSSGATARPSPPEEPREEPLPPPYNDYASKLVRGKWLPYFLPTGTCKETIAKDPAASVPAIDWQPCPGEASEWACSLANWGTYGASYEVTSQTPAWVDGKPVFPIRRTFAWSDADGGVATLESLQTLDGPAVYARMHGFRGEACFGELFATDVGVVDTVYADTGSKSLGNQLAWFRWDDPSKVGHRVFHPRDFEARSISSALLGNDRLYVALGTNRTVSLNLATGATERLNLPPADNVSEEDLIYYAGGVATIARRPVGADGLLWYPDTVPTNREWIDNVTEPNQIIHMRIDHGKGEVVWTEFAYADGKWSADGLLKVARPITPGGDVSSDNPPLTYLKPYEFRRGMVVNAGALLFIDTNGDAVIVRTTDGKGWRIAQRSPIQHVAPVWIDDAFVWLTVSTQAPPTGSRDFTPGGLVRIPRSTLGEAGNVYGL